LFLYPERAVLWGLVIALNLLLVNIFLTTLFGSIFRDFDRSYILLLSIVESYFFLVKRRYYEDRGESHYDEFKDRISRVYLLTLVQRKIVTELYALLRSFFYFSLIYALVLALWVLRVRVIVRLFPKLIR
jgi:hypothetical protein